MCKTEESNQTIHKRSANYQVGKVHSDKRLNKLRRRNDAIDGIEQFYGKTK